VNADTADHRRGAGRYEIRLDGLLAPRWAAAFDPMTVTTHGDGTTSLSGTLIDQAALHGLLTKLRDLGLPLLSLTQFPSDPAPATRTAPANPNNPPQGD
jgi:hypothetical protein